jgi:prevent-host-death family protein
MKTVTAKELRAKTSEILEETRKGNEVLITLRGKPVATLRPLTKKEHAFKRVGFGLWKDRVDLEEPGKWVEERRNERKEPPRTV